MAGSSKNVRYGDDHFEETLTQWFDEHESELSDYEELKTIKTVIFSQRVTTIPILK